MGKKKYVSLTGVQYTFPVKTKNDKVVWVSFKGNDSDYVTSNKDVQEAIEATEKFRNGEIGISDRVVDTGEDNSVNGDSAGIERRVYEDVTDFQMAKEILRGAPYCVSHQSISNPKLILAKAEELGVVFPALKLTE